MLPPDLQGYAPQITGIAQTNAKVTVAQNGRVLYQTTVAPCPLLFLIWGTVSGAVGCHSGRRRWPHQHLRVGSASIPYLTRKGQVRYKASLGKPTSVGHNDINNPFFWTAEASRGWLNNVSLYGGGMFTADDYQAITTGIGFNLNQFGSLSLMSPEQTPLCSNKIATICVVTAIASTMQSISNRQVVRLPSRVIASQIKITCR